MSRIGRTYQELLNEREQYINPDHLTKYKKTTMMESPDLNNNKQLENILTGNMKHNKLSLLFFSSKNITNLQNIIRLRVYKKIKMKIARQSDNELVVIMKSVFVTYTKNMDSNYTQQIKILNEIVLDEVMPKLLADLEMYKYYLKDKNTSYTLIDRPIYLSSSGTRVLDLDTARGF